MEKIRRPLTPYGLWAKTVLLEKGMNMRDLERDTGISIDILSKMFRGHFAGLKHRAEIEKALGETPPADVAS